MNVTPLPPPTCQAVFGAITGAEVFLVYSPSCLRPQQGSAGQARLQLLAGLATPCAVLLAALGLWVTRCVCVGGGGAAPARQRGELGGPGGRRSQPRPIITRSLSSAGAACTLAQIRT